MKNIFALLIILTLPLMVFAESYQLIRSPLDGQIHSVRRISDGACIPFDLANRDYKAYLVWAKTNTALPPPPVPSPTPNQNQQ